MRSLIGLLNQNCTISAKGVIDTFGKFTFGTPVAVSCRFQSTTRTIASQQNEIEPIDGIVFVGPSTVVGSGDKLTFNGVDYRVMKLQPMIDGRGNTRHYELLVQEWNV